MIARLFLMGVLLLFADVLIAQEDLIDSRDGHVYKTIKIKDQVWMAQNLNYESKDSIFFKEEVLTFIKSMGIKAPPNYFIPDSHCYYDSVANCDKYGRLYTWKAAQKACPAGWHLPRKVDYDYLLGAIGVEKKTVNHSIMKGGSSGFDLLFGGKGLEMFVMSTQQNFASKNIRADFWTSAYIKLGKTAIYGTTIGFSYTRKGKVLTTNCSIQPDYLFSVRCIKD